MTAHPHVIHCKKGFVIMTIVLLTRIATVDMVLWDDTRIVPSDSQLWAIQCTWSSYAGTTECYILHLGVCLELDKCYTQQRALFPYNDSCHVNYSAHKVSVP